MGRSYGWDLAACAVILLGLMQLPQDMGLTRLAQDGASMGWRGAAVVLVDLVHLLPLLLAVAALFGARIGAAAAWALIGGTALPAVLLTLGAAYDSGGGASIILVEGLALSLACWGVLWRVGGWFALGRVALGAALLAAIWSLATPFAVASSARALAWQDAFCIARHEPDRPMRSWAELRGVSFHTNRSGFKDSSNWYLHGVLLIERPQGIEVWNWSPQAMRFDPLARAGDLVVTPVGACQPVQGFLAGLTVL